MLVVADGNFGLEDGEAAFGAEYVVFGDVVRYVAGSEGGVNVYGGLSEYTGIVVLISLQTIPAVRVLESDIICVLADDASKLGANVRNAIFYGNTGTVTQDGKCSSKVEHDCTPYEDALQKAMRQVTNRYLALQLDESNLYCDAYDTPAPGKTGTWLGHLQQFRDRQAQLLAAIAAAEAAHCPVPAEAYVLANLPPPLCPGGKIPRQ